MTSMDETIRSVTKLRPSSIIIIGITEDGCVCSYNYQDVRDFTLMKVQLDRVVDRELNRKDAEFLAQAALKKAQRGTDEPQ